jgi:hypothetical protein
MGERTNISEILSRNSKYSGVQMGRISFKTKININKN